MFCFVLAQRKAKAWQLWQGCPLTVHDVKKNSSGHVQVSRTAVPPVGSIVKKHAVCEPLWLSAARMDGKMTYEEQSTVNTERYCNASMHLVTFALSFGPHSRSLRLC